MDIDWWKLGKELQVSTFYLRSIEHGNSGVGSGTIRDPLMMLLFVWLRKDRGVSWEILADAVERCGYNKTAENIRERKNIFNRPGSCTCM